MWPLKFIELHWDFNASLSMSSSFQDEDKFKFGRTKIFFRAGQVAYMEKLRADRLSACGVMIQKHVRMYLHRNRFRTMRKAAITIQKYARGMAARRWETGVSKHESEASTLESILSYGLRLVSFLVTLNRLTFVALLCTLYFRRLISMSECQISTISVLLSIKSGNPID